MSPPALESRGLHCPVLSATRCLVHFLARSTHTFIFFEPMNERVRPSAKNWAETVGQSSGNHQMPLRRGPSPQGPHPGQRSDSPWVVLHWLDQHEVQKPQLGWGETWPLLFRPCWQRDLPHLALSISLAVGCRLAFHMARGTFPSAQPRGDFPLQLSSYIPFTKNNLDLKMCEHIIRKKVRWKNVVKKE